MSDSKRRSRKPEITKTLLGVYKIKFDCPGCSERLTANLNDAGDIDQCPTCMVKFRTPGIKQLEKLRNQQAEEKTAKWEAKRASKEAAAIEKQQRQAEKSKSTVAEVQNTSEVVGDAVSDREASEGEASANDQK